MVILANKENKRDKEGVAGGCNYRVVGEGLFKEVTFEWSLESKRLAS